jgi:hypothetical protein
LQHSQFKVVSIDFANWLLSESIELTQLSPSGFVIATAAVGECMTTALTRKIQGLANNEKLDLCSVCHIFVVLLVAHSPTAAVAITKPGEKTQNSIMTSALSPEKAGCAAP